MELTDLQTPNVLLTDISNLNLGSEIQSNAPQNLQRYPYSEQEGYQPPTYYDSSILQRIDNYQTEPVTTSHIATLEKDMKNMSLEIINVDDDSELANLSQVQIRQNMGRPYKDNADEEDGKES